MLTQKKWAIAYTKNGVILDYSLKFYSSRKEARDIKNLLKPNFIKEVDFKIQIFKVFKNHSQITFIKTR